MSGTSKITQRIIVRLPNEVVAILKQKADEHGVSFSEFVRPALLKLAKNGKRGGR